MIYPNNLMQNILVPLDNILHESNVDNSLKITRFFYGCILTKVMGKWNRGLSDTHCPSFSLFQRRDDVIHRMYNIWGHWCQKQVSHAGISNQIPQFTVGYKIIHPCLRYLLLVPKSSYICITLRCISFPIVILSAPGNCCDLFTHTLQSYFKIILKLPRCLWS